MYYLTHYFYYTNLCPFFKLMTDYFNKNFLGFLLIITRICMPIGVILGKIMIPICLLQIYFLYNNKYDEIIYIHIILLLIGFVLSFLNIRLQQNILPAFILQLLVVIIPS